MSLFDYNQRSIKFINLAIIIHFRKYVQNKLLTIELDNEKVRRRGIEHTFRVKQIITFYFQIMRGRFP